MSRDPYIARRSCFASAGGTFMSPFRSAAKCGRAVVDEDECSPSTSNPGSVQMLIRSLLISMRVSSSDWGMFETTSVIQDGQIDSQTARRKNAINT